MWGVTFVLPKKPFLLQWEQMRWNILTAWMLSFRLYYSKRLQWQYDPGGGDFTMHKPVNVHCGIFNWKLLGCSWRLISRQWSVIFNINSWSVWCTSGFLFPFCTYLRPVVKQQMHSYVQVFRERLTWSHLKIAIQRCTQGRPAIYSHMVFDFYGCYNHTL